MNAAFAAAKARILAPSGLTVSDLEKALSRLSGPGIDAADAYFQHTHIEHWTVDNGTVTNASHQTKRGVGTRAVSGEKTGFAYTDEIGIDRLLEAAVTARAIASSDHGFSCKLEPRSHVSLYPASDPAVDFEDAAKVTLLRDLDSFARTIDRSVRQVVIKLFAIYDVILLASSDGVLAADARPRVCLDVQVIVESHQNRGIGTAASGGRCSYRDLIESGRADSCVLEAVRQALVNLHATEAPAGTMDVVLGTGLPGIMLHEAVGHSLEADTCRKGASVFSGRIGEQVAADGVTIVDNGTLPGSYGSLSMDDEGIATRCTTLIEDGRLVGYLQDRQNSKLMRARPTGNGRRQSFAHLPMPRMTNTYMLAGTRHPEEIISSVKRGIYAVHFGSGQVDVASGKFVFNANEAYLIENGKITNPVKGATLAGSGPNVLQQISMIGNDLQLDTGGAICTKQGQSVPVSVGMPTILIESMVVGGVNTGSKSYGK